MQGQRAGFLSSVAVRLYANPYLLWLSIIIVLMAGFAAFNSLPRIEDPRITNRYPNIQTFVPGSSAERVESLVTERLEDELEELDEIKVIESTSREGISVLAVELQDSIGPGENQQVFSKIRDKLSDAAADLPLAASDPNMDDKNEAVAFSLLVAIRWTRDEAPPLGLMYRLSEQLADELRLLPGTELVRFYGAPQEEISVTVEPDTLVQMGLTAESLAGLVAGADPKIPAGALRNAERNLFIEVDGELDSVASIKATPLISNQSGGVVRLGDVAEVTRGWQTPTAQIAYANGARSIYIGTRTKNDIRLDKWAVDARDLVAQFNDGLGGGIEATVVFDQSTYTEERLSSLGGNLLAGAVVVMIVVFLGMGWRAALIVGTALPLSTSLALFGVGIFGQQLHQMSIFGMLVSIGLLIDAAIVMTDEIKKYLDAGATRMDALRNSVNHLFVPLLASTMTTILGFMPVFLLPGAMGDFVGPVAISVVLAVSASFILAVTITPVLGARFIRRCEPGQTRHWYSDGMTSRRLSEPYRRILRACVRRPGVTALVCLVLPFAGFVLSGQLGQEFFPPADRDQFEIQVWMAPGTSIEATAELTYAIDNRLAEEAGITDVHWLVGASFPTVYYNRIMIVKRDAGYAQAVIFTDTVKDANALTRSLSSELSDSFPQARIVVAPFAQGPPVTAPVGFRIEGPDINTLIQLGDELREIMLSVPDVLQTSASMTGGEPKLSFVADEVAVRRAGLSLNDVALQMQANLEGRTGGSVREGREELPVRIRYDAQSRGTLTQLASTQLVGAQGAINAMNVGDFELRPEPGSITRENSVRSNKVFGYIRRDALAVDVSNAIEAKIAERGFEMPPGYRLFLEGDSNEQSNAIGLLVQYLPVLLLLMIATIVLSFRSVRLAAVIGVVAVLSIGLGMLALWVGGYTRGFNAIIGLAGLIGVAINGTIVVLAAIRADRDACQGDAEKIVDCTIGSTRHIVSTIFTTIGGFVPLIFFSGGDFWPPLAVVIAGGVGFSITLSLFFTPAMYMLLCRWSERTSRPIYATVNLEEASA